MAPSLHLLHHHHLLLLPSQNPPASSSSELAFWVRAARVCRSLRFAYQQQKRPAINSKREKGAIAGLFMLQSLVPTIPNPAEQCKYFSGSMCYCTSSVSASLTIRAFDPYPES